MTRTPTWKGTKTTTSSPTSSHAFTACVRRTLRTAARIVTQPHARM